MSARREKTILVVEDDLDLVLAMQKRLADAGFRVSIARNGTDAFRHARAGGIDAITLDVGLWDQIDGLDVASILSREADTAHIPIVFITGRADERFQKLYKESGARYFLTKPCDVELLVRVLDGIFGADEWDPLESTCRHASLSIL